MAQQTHTHTFTQNSTEEQKLATLCVLQTLVKYYTRHSCVCTYLFPVRILNLLTHKHTKHIYLFMYYIT